MLSRVFYLVISIAFLLSCDSQKSVLKPNSVPIKYLALGDSYTIGESVMEEERWPVQLRDSLTDRGSVFEEFKIIATTGWRTDDLSRAMDKEELKNKYNLVSLLIGVNNQYQGKSVDSYKPEFEALLDKAVSLAGGKKDQVFVVSIPDYAFTPFGQGRDFVKISTELESYNTACKQITLDKGIKHIDITKISKDGVKIPELVASDGLHPSAKQYTLWVEKILKEKF